MKVLKIFGVLVGAVIICFFVIAKFSIIESRFQCSGEISSHDTSAPASVFLKQERYRWWVGLWSDSEGRLWVEIPNRTIEYYDRLETSGDLVQIVANKGQKGLFSTLSNALTIDVGAFGYFEGTCKKVEQ